jgi:ankyrin repeat protein
MTENRQMRDFFIQAVIDDQCEAVVNELAIGRDPNAPDEFGWIPLHRAAANNSVAVAKILLEAGSSLSATGTDAWTPLHLASVSGSAEVVEMLIAAGADPDALSVFGDTPLHLCVTSCDVRAAEMLLRAGANPHVLNRKGLSPLAKARNKRCAAIADLLEGFGKRK